MMLELRDGLRASWGPPEAMTARDKARAFGWVLADVHRRLGKTGFVDLRFFEDGRIVVRPKSAV